MNSMVINGSIISTSNFKDYDLPQFGNLTVLDQIESLLNVIQRADDLSLFKLPETQQEKEVLGHLSSPQITTLHTRLCLLGYIDQKDPPEWEKTGVIKITPRMRDAIRRFKEEAGLAKHENDNWMDQETWKILDELVSFEEPFHEENWAEKSDENRKALRRAVGVRLAVFGFLDTPTYDKKKIKKALDAFDQVVRMLAPEGLPPTDGVRIGDEELQNIDRLFDQHSLVKCLAAFKKDFTIQPADSLTQDEADQKVNKFTSCVANVELWLLGYTIDLKENYTLIPKTYFKLSTLPETKEKDTEDSPFYILRDFWRDSGQRKKESLFKANEGITGDFFNVILRVINKSEKLQFVNHQSERLYKQLEEKTGPRSLKDLLPLVWKEIKELSSRMWDGIKRAWTWLVRQFNTASTILINKATNVARLAYHFAVDAFQKVKTTSENFIRSLKYVTPVHGSVENTQYLHVSKELDYILVIPDRSGEIEQVTTLGKEMLKGAQDFGSGIRVLSLLLNTLKTTVLLIVIPGAGWFAFILALVKIIGAAFT
jgi:hypothetical protein